MIDGGPFQAVRFSSESTRPVVSLVMTVRNDPEGVDLTLSALKQQTRTPDEIIVVDGGSTDHTRMTIERHSATNPAIRLISAPGANIAQGRNIGTRAASADIIATTDAGCSLAPDWLEKLIAPFEREPRTEFVAGFYRIAPQTLFEEVVGLATMRGQLDPVDPARFKPSARSVAFRKSVWQRVGGWPEWLRFSEDTWFDERVRETGAVWRFAGDAVVDWRPRGTWRSLARQFYNYGTGRGQTGIDRASFHYNLRNLLIVLTLAMASLFSPWFLVPLAMVMLYVYVWTFHDKARRIAAHTKQPAAYALSFPVCWVVLFSNLAGYLVGALRKKNATDMSSAYSRAIISAPVEKQFASIESKHCGEPREQSLTAACVRDSASAIPRVVEESAH